MDTAILRSLISGIHVRSNYGPDIDVLDPFSPTPQTETQGKTAASILQKLQPQITFDTPGDPVIFNPYGVPGPTRWDEVLAGTTFFGSIAIGLAMYGLYKLTLGR